MPGSAGHAAHPCRPRRPPIVLRMRVCPLAKEHGERRRVLASARRGGAWAAAHGFRRAMASSIGVASSAWAAVPTAKRECVMRAADCVTGRRRDQAGDAVLVVFSGGHRAMAQAQARASGAVGRRGTGAPPHPRLCLVKLTKF